MLPFVSISSWASGVLAQVAPAAPAAPAGGTPQSAAPGGGSAASQGSSMLSLLLPVLIFVGFYFFLIRPQQKKAKELDTRLKKGDRVVTNSGLIGQIVEISDKRVVLEIAKNTQVRMLRSAVAGIDEADDAKKPEADAKIAEAKK